MSRLESVLEDLSHDAPRPAPQPDLWDRGRRLRRRDRAVSAGLVLVLVLMVGGLASLVTARPSAVAPAGDVVPDGAIPSRIAVPPSDTVLETDLAVGPASVAFFDRGGRPVVLGATDGRAHVLDLPGLPADRGPLALSPDGRRLAWRLPSEVWVADLASGSVESHEPAITRRAAVTDVMWETDSHHLVWRAESPAGARTGRIDVLDPDQGQSPMSSAFPHGSVSPDGSIVALPTRGPRAAGVPFRRTDGGSRLERTLPPDLYPRGASMTPLGWAADHLVVAQAWAGQGSYVVGQHLVLFTSPDRPESEWTFRILVRDLPSGIPISVAVDLVPDLDGTSSQQLTHDFGSYDVGLPAGVRWAGTVLAALGALLATYLLWRRERRLG